MAAATRLGTGDGPPRADVHVAWVLDGELRYKRVSVTTTSANAQPTATLVRAESARSPYLGVDGSRRVVLAYQHLGETRARVSEDRGQTFGRRVVVWPAPCRDCEAGSLPTGVDILRGVTVIEALGGDPGGFRGAGFLSSDGGTTWQEISSHDGAAQVGALVELPGSVVGVAEAWDTSSRTPEPTRHRLRFHVGPS